MDTRLKTQLATPIQGTLPDGTGVNITPADIFSPGLKGYPGPVETYLLSRLTHAQQAAFEFMKEVYKLHLRQEACNELSSEGDIKQITQADIVREIQQLIVKYDLTPVSVTKFTSLAEEDEDSVALNISNGDKRLCCTTPLDINNFTNAFKAVFSDFRNTSNLRAQGEMYQDDATVKANLGASLIAQQEEEKKPELLEQRKEIEVQRKLEAQRQLEEKRKIMEDERKLQTQRQLGMNIKGQLDAKIEELKKSRSTLEADTKPYKNSAFKTALRRFYYKRIIKKPQPNQLQILNNLTALIDCFEQTSSQLDTILKAQYKEDGAKKLTEAVNDCMNQFKNTYPLLNETLLKSLPPKDQKEAKKEENNQSNLDKPIAPHR